MLKWMKAKKYKTKQIVFVCFRFGTCSSTFSGFGVAAKLGWVHTLDLFFSSATHLFHLEQWCCWQEGLLDDLFLPFGLSALGVRAKGGPAGSVSDTWLCNYTSQSLKSSWKKDVVPSSTGRVWSSSNQRSNKRNQVCCVTLKIWGISFPRIFKIRAWRAFFQIRVSQKWQVIPHQNHCSISTDF